MAVRLAIKYEENCHHEMDIIVEVLDFLVFV